MKIAYKYAKALRELAQTHPESAREYFKNLRGVLAHRGHEKLLLRVIESYESLDTGEARRARSRRESAEEKRTKVLVELYRKLIAS